MIEIGNQAPLDIMVTDTLGNQTSLRELLGSYVVLYAYPKDETPGCIKEACSIRDVYDEFKKIGVVVLGISPDDEKSHKKFIEKHKLQFSLWVDTNHELLNALGVWGERSFMGKKYIGVARTTFLIDRKGVVVYVWENVKPEGHGEAVFEYVRNIVSS